jgi:glc operon protein GlcG
MLFEGSFMKKIISTMITISGLFAFAAEKNLINDVGLNLEVSQKITKKALACGEKNNWKLSVAIVNSEGNLISFQRTDGAFVGSIDAAKDKAFSANAFQRPTKTFADSIKEGRLGLLSVKNVVAIEGGIPIIINGKHVGGIGVSGAKAIEDEQCAKAALE